MRAKAAALLLAGALLVATSAVASTARSYVLKHPKREGCKAEYTRKTRMVTRHGHKVKQTVCVLVPPTIHGLPPQPCTPSPPETVMFLRADAHALPDAYRFDVEGTVTVRCGAALIGVPITYTLKNETTGQALGLFTEPSDPAQPCTILSRAGVNGQTFIGEAVAPYSGCPLGRVSMPAGQIAVLTASFAGDSTYAASTDSQTL